MILIVDDDPAIAASLELLLKQAGYPARSVGTPGKALPLLADGSCRLLLQDMNFSTETTGEEGLELLRAVKDRHPRLPVILITAWGSIELAVQGMRLGAFDFLTKPWSNERMIQAVRTALGVAGARPREAAPVSREELDRRYDFSNIVGSDPQLMKILDIAGRVGPTDASVLITGESGTGKDEVAAAVVRNSARRDRPFVKVNLGGISTSLFESEMFGHVKGAFTDARADRRGRFSMADGGTIFLDEIGDLEPSSQVKLLRVLQERTFEVLGSSEIQAVDVRVVAATNRDLPGMVAAGDFREDLFYRLNLISLHLPPLRRRRGDIPDLARHLLRVATHTHGRDELELTEGALDWLRAREWPGNVRELRQLLERTVLISPGDRLDSSHLAAALAMEPETSPRQGGFPEAGSMTLDEVERAVIQRCLERYGNNLTSVAAALGLSRGSLYRRLEKHGIRP